MFLFSCHTSYRQHSMILSSCPELIHHSICLQAVFSASQAAAFCLPYVSSLDVSLKCFIFESSIKNVLTAIITILRYLFGYNLNVMITQSLYQMSIDSLCSLVNVMIQLHTFIYYAILYYVQFICIFFNKTKSLFSFSSPLDFLFKFLVIGNAGTGKSCLLHQFIEKRCMLFSVILSINQKKKKHEMLHPSMFCC